MPTLSDAMPRTISAAAPSARLTLGTLRRLGGSDSAMASGSAKNDLRRSMTRRSRFLRQSVARRRFRAVGPVQPETPAQFGVLGPKRFNFASQRVDQLYDLGRKSHPTLKSEHQPKVSKNTQSIMPFPQAVAFQTHPAPSRSRRRLHFSRRGAKNVAKTGGGLGVAMNWVRTRRPGWRCGRPPGSRNDGTDA